jgi:hypothetical protein
MKVYQQIPPDLWFGGVQGHARADVSTGSVEASTGEEAI